MNKKLCLYLVLLISIFTINLNVFAEEEVNTTQDTNTTLISPNDTKEEKQDTYKYINKETNYIALVEDNANLLTEGEKKQLLDKMSNCTEYGHAVFLTITENYTSPDNYAKQDYYKRFGNESGTLFLIDMKNRYLYIVSGGANYKYITRQKANIITDNVYMEARGEKYYDCAYKAFDQIEEVLKGNKILEPMRYASNIVLSILIAFSLCYIYVLIKTDVSKASNETVLGKCDINVEVANIHSDKTGQRKVFSPQVNDSSSSGGFSSGSSSGGGFSGGGGGGGGGFSGGGGGHGF